MERDTVADAALRELLLALSSDWAFMVTKDSAANYARGRAAGHHDRLERVMAGLEVGGSRPFPHLDSRLVYP